RDLGLVARAFQTAWQSDPRHVVAGLNLAEVLALVGQRDQAIEQARRTLAMLETIKALPSKSLDAARVPTDYDSFRAEWEKAASQSAGDDAKEKSAKRRLLRWRLHRLLADLTNDLTHRWQSWHERPDLDSGLGGALIAANKPAEAVSHLR